MTRRFAGYDTASSGSRNRLAVVEVLKYASSGIDRQLPAQFRAVLLDAYRLYKLDSKPDRLSPPAKHERASVDLIILYLG